LKHNLDNITSQKWGARHIGEPHDHKRGGLEPLGPIGVYAYGRVVPKFHTTRTRPDQTHGPLGSSTSPRTLSGRRLVRSISTCTDFVRGPRLVGSQTKSVGPCIVKFDTYQTLSETWSQARTSGRVWSGPVRPVQWNLETTRPDPTGDKVWPGPCQIPLHGHGPDWAGPDQTKSARTQRTLSPKSGRARVVEFGQYCTLFIVFQTVSLYCCVHAFIFHVRPIQFV